MKKYITQRKPGAFIEIFMVLPLFLTLGIFFSWAAQLQLQKSQIHVGTATATNFGESKFSKKSFRSKLSRHLKANRIHTEEFSTQSKSNRNLIRSTQNIFFSKIPIPFKVALEVSLGKNITVTSKQKTPEPIKKILLQLKSRKEKLPLSQSMAIDSFTRGDSFKNNSLLKYALHYDSLLAAGFSEPSIDLITTKILLGAVL